MGAADLGSGTEKGPEYSGSWLWPSPIGVEVPRGAMAGLTGSTMPATASSAAFKVSTSLASLVAFC